MFFFLLECHSINHENYLFLYFCLHLQEDQVCVNETLKGRALTIYKQNGG